MTADRRPADGPGLTLGAALLTNGLMAGLFYAYTCSVIIGLGRTDDRTFIDAMQQINDAIQNPVFFVAFFGALVFPAIAVWQQRRRGRRDVTRWTLAATVLYAIALVVTFAANIPLNDDLAAAGDPARIADVAAVRDHFEDPWVAWNIVRGVASTAALACLGWALVLYGRARATTR